MVDNEQDQAPAPPPPQPASVAYAQCTDGTIVRLTSATPIPDWDERFGGFDPARDSE